MSAVNAATFTGFPREGIQFLADLAAHNDRAWFQPRKGDYERYLKEPLEALIAALGERFEQRGIPLLADPRRSPFRIYRDVRFSRDKSPYKTNVGASFPWLEEESAGTEAGHGAGGYFHLEPGEAFAGGGMWHPEPARLAAFRSALDSDWDRVAEAIEAPQFVRVFGGVHGDRLKRVPSGYPSDHPRAELLKLKDVVFSRRLSDEDVLSPRLPDVLADTFEAGLPVFRLLAHLPS